jgi:hypothetical protein
MLMAQAMCLAFHLVNISIAVSWMTFVLVLVIGTGKVIFPQRTCSWIQTFENWFYILHEYGDGAICGRSIHSQSDNDHRIL